MILYRKINNILKIANDRSFIIPCDIFEKLNDYGVFSISDCSVYVI